MDIKLAFLLTVFLASFSHIAAQMKCHSCMATNGAYCINETSYYLCLNGINPSNATLSTCDKGHVCTDAISICEPERSSGGVVTWPACSSACGFCPDSADIYHRYTCVSRTHFARCVKNSVTILAQCETDHICSSELYAKTGVICAPHCVIDFYGVSASCASEEVITTTSTTAPPINTETIKKQCRHELPNHPNEKTFNIRNTDDNECKTYIFCEEFDNEVDGLLVKCAVGYWFDLALAKCGNAKPLECSPTIS